MYFEMQSLNSEQRSNILHSLVLPRPIAWISSVAVSYTHLTLPTILLV